MNCKVLYAKNGAFVKNNRRNELNHKINFLNVHENIVLMITIFITDEGIIQIKIRLLQCLVIIPSGNMSHTCTYNHNEL